MRWRPPAQTRVCLLLGWLLVAAPAGWQDTRSKPDRTIEITAQRFHFRPAKVVVRTGTRLLFRLRSRDTTHGFHIVGTGIDVTIPGRGRGTAEVEFQPREPGRYVFRCSRQCGAGHAQMRGQLMVKPKADRSP